MEALLFSGLGRHFRKATQTRWHEAAGDDGHGAAPAVDRLFDVRFRVERESAAVRPLVPDVDHHAVLRAVRMPDALVAGGKPFVLLEAFGLMGFEPRGGRHGSRRSEEHTS